MKEKKYKIYGPVQDGMFRAWHVIGPRGGFVAEFFTRQGARDYVRSKNLKRKRR